jgi:glycosyltransferase involved in cell wall biosynthesis
MRILHVIGSIDPAKGGPSAGVVRLAAAQALVGHRVMLAGHASPEALQRAHAAANDVPGLSLVEFTVLGGGTRADTLAPLIPGYGRARLGACVAGADVVHLHGVWEPLLLAAAALCRARATPYVCCPHGMLDEWSMRQKRLKKRLALALGFRRMLDGAAFIHALNTDEMALMRPLALRAPVSIIPNGIFPEEFSTLPAAGTFRRAHPGLGDRPFVLFLSRLHAKKGLDILAAAFTELAGRLPDVHLVVAGPDEGAGKSFAAAIATRGLSARVFVVGPLYGRDKLAALVDSAVFCLPSRQEGFSIAITEALAVGRPVVISQACHFPEVGAAGAGHVTSLDPSRIAEALEAVLNDRKAAEAMGERGRALVLSRFTWPKIAERATLAYAAAG